MQAREGVAQVARVGGVTREINVVLEPDRLAARGVPDEFMFIATERMKAINNAYSQIAGKTAA